MVYIDAYNMKEAHNRKLLELANEGSSVHQRDLKDMSRYNSQHVPIILHIVHTKFILPIYIAFCPYPETNFSAENESNYSNNF